MSRVWIVTQRVWNSPFGKSLIAIVVLQVLFGIFAFTEYLPRTLLSNGVEHALTVVLLSCVYLLVMINTILLILEAAPQVAGLEHKISEPDVAKNVSGKFKAFTFVLVISVLISGGLLFTVVMSLFSNQGSSDSWQGLLTVNELLSVVLFGSFLYADICCLDACELVLDVDRKNRTLSDAETSRLTHFRGMVRLYALCVDGPGLLGIVVILILSNAIHPVVAGYYWHGFVAGAIGLHMAFSQTVLALLGGFMEAK